MKAETLEYLGAWYLYGVRHSSEITRLLSERNKAVEGLRLVCQDLSLVPHESVMSIAEKCSEALTYADEQKDEP